MEEESTLTVMAVLRAMIERHGLFRALYSDPRQPFLAAPEGRRQGVSASADPRVWPALRELGIQMIPAYSPQPRGRSERN